MLKGFWNLTWIEIKVFMREPMGVIGSIVIPIFLYVVLGRMLGSGRISAPGASAAPFNVAILAALFIAIGAVLSLIAIITIYREGGILKRLRATPLSPVTILGAHVVVKLLFTVVSMAVLVIAGRQFFPGAIDVNIVSFTAALLLGTVSILSMGFVVASIVPTARFAQPIGAALFWPMVAVSGLFVPVEQFPTMLKATVMVLPTTHAVALMEGVWNGGGWLAHSGNVAALVLLFLAFTAISARVFRWE